MLALLTVMPAFGADWPQYRGPNRDGVVPASSADGAWNPRVAWRQPIGEGFSAIVIVGSALYTLEAKDGQEAAVSFDVATGMERWRRDLGPIFEESFGNGPRSTPTVADGVVYALGSRGRLAALDAATGKVRWQIELPEEVGGKAPRFGYSPSPLVASGLVMLEVGAGEGKSIAAFDRRTGEPRWTAHSDRMGYSSPIMIDLAGGRDAVFVTATTVVGLSMTGDVRWTWPIVGGSVIDQPIAMPVAVGEDGLFVAHRAEGGSSLLRLETDDEGGVEPRVVWENRFMLNHLSSSVYSGGHLYGFHNAILKCLDAATGSQRWARRGMGKGSLIAHGGDLVVLADDGQLVVVRATPDAYQETVRLQVLPGRAWTAPSAAGGALYVRNHEAMARVDLMATVAPAGTPAPETDVNSPETLGRVAEPGEVAGASHPGLDEILAAHVAAIGGAERLSQIRSLRLRGRYAEASVYGDFELLRQRGRRYRFEHRRDDDVVIKVLDGASEDGERGATAWWVHPTESPEPGPMPAAEVANLVAEAELLGPLVDARAKGHQLELIGAAVIDAGEAWELRLTRDTGAVETWFLDRESHLALERISRLWAYDEEWELHTHYSDYREVDGLVLPFLIEYEFSSIHRLLRVEAVEIDGEVDPRTFHPPAGTAGLSSHQTSRDDGATNNDNE